VAFQHTAFQNNAFQIQAGSEDTTPLGTTILDGANDAVSFLEQEAEYLTTLGDSLGQAPDGGNGCGFPLVKSISTGDFGQSSSSWTMSVPAGGVGGDLAVFFIVFGSTPTLSTVNNGWTIANSTTDTNGSVSVVWKYLNGTGDTTINVTASGNPTGYSYHYYLIEAGTTAGVNPEFVVSAVNSLDPPAISPSWGADKSLVVALAKLSGTGSSVTGWPYSNGRTVLASIQTNESVSSYGTFEAASEDPATYTMSVGSGQFTVTAAVRGACFEDPLPKCEGPDVYELGLELPDGEGFTQNGVRENDVPLDCIAPVVSGSNFYTDAAQVASTTHSIPMPSTVAAGDLLFAVLLVEAAATNKIATPPSGWTAFSLDTSVRYSADVYAKIADGTEGGTSPTFTFPAATTVTGVSFRVLAGTYNPDLSAVSRVALTGSAATWDPPSNTFTGNETDTYAYVAIGSFSETNTLTLTTVATYPAGYTDLQVQSATQDTALNVRLVLGLATTTGTAATFDPGTGTFTAATNSRKAASFSIRGFCGTVPVWTDQNPAEDYAWDDADYGTQSDVSLDFVPEEPGNSPLPDDSEYLIDDADYGFEQDAVGDDFPQDFLLGIEDGNTRDDTDYADYSTYTDPVGDDADLGQSIIDTRTDVEDATYTDFTDYGTQSDPQIDDADLGQSIIEDGNNRDDTDYEPYGTQTDPLSDDFPQDFPQALIDDGNNVEDPTYADWFEYGTQSSIVDEVLFFEDFVLGVDDGTTLEDPTFTDFTDYGTQSDPQIDDVDLAQGIWEDGNTRDDTDYEPYGTQTDPLSPDLPEDFVLGIDHGTTLEDPTGADWFEYGTQTDPLADDVDLGQSVIDSGNNVEDATYTDFADYGTQSDPLAPDVDLAQGIIDSGDNLEDPTGADWFEYGAQTDPLSPDAAEDHILGIDDGTNLADPTQTDTADYGTQSDILLFLQEDFNLGTGDGLDSQDFTDTADYGFTQDAIGNMTGGTLDVPVTGVSGTGGVGHVCPTIYADIADPSGSYTPITDPTGSYTPITQGTVTYTPVTDPSGSWDPIVDPAATWTKVDDC
jgi:hypothetical protein